MGNIIFTTAGMQREEDLDLRRPVVYQANRRFKKSDSLPPTNSATIPFQLAKELSRIKGQFTFTKYKDEYRNMHLYTNNATTMDGLERVCCFSYEPATATSEERIRVSEYGNGRNSHYSGWYRELASQLRQAGYVEENETFYIQGKRITQFVDIVNRMLSEEMQDELELVAVNEVDSMAFGINDHSVRYYYYKAYWKRKAFVSRNTSPSQEAIEAVLEPEIEQLSADVRKLLKATSALVARGRVEEVQRIDTELKDWQRRINDLRQSTQTIVDALNKLKIACMPTNENRVEE